ncbi:MAG: hypothetical protein ACOYXB_04080 [Bacteroidota bacterium]
MDTAGRKRYGLPVDPDTAVKNRFLKAIVRLALPLLFLLFLSDLELQARSDTIVSMAFVKERTELPTSGSFLNILRLKNHQDKDFNGELQLIIPEKWILIGSKVQEVSIPAGGTLLVPVRLSIPPSALGGVAFMISAEVRDGNFFNYINSYVTLTRKSDWEMKIENKRLFISSFRPYGDFSLHLRNRGNADELIKLRFDMGGLIAFRNPPESDSLMFIQLPAYTDTLIPMQLLMKKDVSYSEKRVLEQNWKATQLYVLVSTREKKQFGAVRAVPLESSYSNYLPDKNSPVNLEMNIYNLLSSQKPKMSARVQGKVLFPGTQQLQYNLGFYNIYLAKVPNRTFDLYQQMRYRIRYDDEKVHLTVGDRMGVGSLHTISGEGISGQYSLTDDQVVYLNAMYNPFGKNFGAYAGYSRMIGKVAVNGGFTLESGNKGEYNFYSLHLGASYRFLRYHTLRLQTATSLSYFKPGRYLASDTTKIGFAYRLTYFYNHNKLQIRLDNTNTLFTYLRNSGLNRTDFNGQYAITGQSRIHVIANHNSFTGTRYPYNFFYPANRNVNDHFRILYSYTNGSVTYQAGPQYFSQIRDYYEAQSQTLSRYSNIQPGLMGSVTFRFGHMRSITPNFNLNSMYYRYTEDPDANVVEPFARSYQYTVGISYYDNAFKLNAYYTSGEATDLYRSVIIEENPVINQAFHIRPYYERYFNKDRIRMSGYLNYSLYMPSQRENLMLSLTSDFFATGGWSYYVNLNLFQNVRVDPELGRFSLRDVNLMVGFRKSFDIQQPRLSYFDMKIIGFNDLNGNGVKEDNEKPVSNVLIRIVRDPSKNGDLKAGFAETEMITDPNGEIYYHNIPEGVYDLSITPLSNLEDLYFMNGMFQEVEIRSDLDYYLPLVESYKVKGKVIIDRDPGSDAGRISLEGIRITAIGETGEVYSTLTSANGAYVLNIPKAGKYDVKINNVFGAGFRLERDLFEVRFEGSRIIQVDFRFTEQRRGIQFREGEQLFQFNLNGGNGNH